MPLLTNACLTPFRRAHERQQTAITFGRLVEPQRRARIGRQAIAAEARLALLEQLAAEAVHVRGRAADVGDRSAEVVVRGHRGGFLQHRLFAATLDRAALMERDRTERAIGHATAVRVQRPTHRLERGDPAFRRVIGMPFAAVGQVVEAVDLGLRRRFVRRVLNDKAFAVQLRERSRARAVLLAHGVEQIDELFPIRFELFEGRHDARIRGQCVERDDLARAWHSGERFTARQALRDRDRLRLGHPPREQIGLAVDEDRSTHAIVPVVVVREPPRPGFETSDDHRQAGKVMSCERGVRDRRAIRSARLAAWTVDVDPAFLLGRGVVRHHRIDCARGDADEELRCGQPLPSRTVVLLLGHVEDADAIALASSTRPITAAPNDG